MQIHYGQVEGRRLAASWLAVSCWLLLGIVHPTWLTASDWLTWPSTYTHSPLTGQRVDQYAEAASPLAPQRSDFSRSGYRHYRSTLQAGQSADNMHIVEQWGRPVVPYEQWRFPFRPYAVPYAAWGPQPPYGIFNGNWGFGGPGYGGPGYGGPGYGGPGYGGRPPSSAPSGFPLTPSYGNEPWYDGSYPTAPPLQLPQGF